MSSTNVSCATEDIPYDDARRCPWSKIALIRPSRELRGCLNGDFDNILGREEAASTTLPAFPPAVLMLESDVNVLVFEELKHAIGHVSEVADGRALSVTVDDHRLLLTGRQRSGSREVSGASRRR